MNGKSIKREDIKCTLPKYQLWNDVVGRNWFNLVCAGVGGRAQTIYLCMYSLSLCWGLNECIFMMWQNDGMIPPRNEAFHRNPTAARPFLRTAGTFSPRVCLLQCLSASVHVLISTHLYIAGLSPHSHCLCVTGKVNSGCCSLNTLLCLSLERENKTGSGRKHHWQAGKHQPAPVPLSPHCL